MIVKSSLYWKRDCFCGSKEADFYWENKMGIILRIKDRFNITGRGKIYLIEMKSDAVIKIGDVFEDLTGNRFRISGIEMFDRYLETTQHGEYCEIGVMFDLVDKKEVPFIQSISQENVNCLYQVEEADGTIHV